MEIVSTGTDACSLCHGHGLIIWLDELHLLLELAGDGVHVDVEVFVKELADIRVLDIATDLLGAVAAGAVDVDVDGGVAVGAPADVGAERNHVGKGMEGIIGVLDYAEKFRLGGVGDTETGDDEFLVDPRLKLVLSGGFGVGDGGEVKVQLVRKPLGRGGSVG